MKSIKTEKILWWVVSYIMAIGAGNFVMNLFENIDLNIWIARLSGAITAGIIGFIAYLCFIKNKKS